jgi:hypothetical protein
MLLLWRVWVSRRVIIILHGSTMHRLLPGTVPLPGVSPMLVLI